MNTNQMKILDLIGKGNSMNSISKKMYTTVQSVHNQLDSLEKEIGTQLTVRTPRGTSLSMDGEKLLPYIRKMIKDYNDGLMAIKKNKPINIGVVRLLIPRWMLRWKSELSSLSKQYSVNFIGQNSFREVVDSFTRKETDIIFCHTEIELPCRFSPVMNDALYVLMSENNPLSKKESINLSDITNQIIYLGDEDSYFSNILQFLSNPFPGCTFIYSSLETIALNEIANSDKTIAFIYGLIKEEVQIPDKIVLRRLQNEMVQFGMYYHEDNEQTKAFVNDIIKSIKSHSRKSQS